MATEVFGVQLDDETRCVHYQTATDIIAIKFKCCGKYYPCHSCHEELESHPSQRWGKSEFGETAVLCGKCRSEFSIEQYLNSGFACPSCHSPFNEGCRLHYHLYFDLPQSNRS